MIRKRDGSLEPFQLNKLRRCLAGVMETCQYDVRVADALSKAVAYHLQTGAAGTVSTKYVYQCVRDVLVDTGLEEVAQELSAHSRFRSVCRRRLRFSDKFEKNGKRQARWRKASVVEKLESSYRVQRPVARILAGEIESRVFSLGYHSVSERLVDELIRNELRCWGLPDDVALISQGVNN